MVRGFAHHTLMRRIDTALGPASVVCSRPSGKRRAT
jgi:hypothetical protein